MVVLLVVTVEAVMNEGEEAATAATARRVEGASIVNAVGTTTVAVEAAITQAQALS